MSFGGTMTQSKARSLSVFTVNRPKWVIIRQLRWNMAFLDRKVVNSSFRLKEGKYR